MAESIRIQKSKSSLYVADNHRTGPCESRPRWSLVARKIRSKLPPVLKSVRNSRRLFALDLMLAMLAMVLAATFRLGPKQVWSAEPDSMPLFTTALVFAAICGIVFPFSGLYVRNWKYASVLDYLVLVRAIAIASLVLTAVLFFYSRLDAIPRSMIAVGVLTLVPLLGLTRLSYRHEDLKTFGSFGRVGRPLFEDLVPVLLVRTSPAADLYLRALQRDPGGRFWPVGFIEDRQTEPTLLLRGVPVLGSPEAFEEIVADLEARGQKPRRLIFTEALSAFDGAVTERLLERADRLGIAVSLLTSPTELRNPRVVEQFELRPIELTDLLERPQTSLDVAAMRRFIYGRRVLVTGAGGSIGSELVKQIAALGPAELTLVENSEFNLYQIDLELAERFPIVKRSAHLCSVRDPWRVDELFQLHRPELVFHAAALKHVPMVEMNPCEGALTNVCGTMNVADSARRWQALAMVQVSTDKVVNSTSVMGATKRLAELYCQALDLEEATKPDGTRFMTVRFGNVLGSSGSLIPLFKRQLARGGPLTVTHPEMKRFFMTIREAVELTLQASAYGLEKRLGHGSIFVLEMGEPIKILNIARRMIRLAGYMPDKDVRIDIVGCRPGEKLFEELFDPSEQRVESPVPGVLGAVPRAVPLSTLTSAFRDIRRQAKQGDEAALFTAIRTVLPEFRGGQAPTPSEPSRAAAE